MNKKIIEEIVKDRNNKSNNEILSSLDFLSEKHDETKKLIIDLTYDLDNIESDYNKLLEEYKKRIKK
jgi:hypothetical protein